MSDIGYANELEVVRAAFEDAKIPLARLELRRFPGETIIIVEVNERDFTDAIVLANNLDTKISNGFITVKKSAELPTESTNARAESLNDPRVVQLIEVLTARSRTSEQQPTLRYVADATNTLSVATSRRHHLIFGRRGVGKTALMLEAKKVAEQRGAATFWINIQPLGPLKAYDAFVTVAMRLCEIPQILLSGRNRQPSSVQRAEHLRGRLNELLNEGPQRDRSVDLLIPQIQEMFSILGQETRSDLFIFLDDIHYLARNEQPKFLHLLHALTRDNAIWLKVAGIKHQSRWFTDNPPVGLQTGHDATIIDLDITLEQPAKAKEFLSNIFRTYTEEARLGNSQRAISNVISSEALDRLVLASGGVPRDFLVLASDAIQVARGRTNARVTGVQDVNEAAGKIKQPKLQEVEDDAASLVGMSKAIIDALNCLRAFLIDEKQFTFFRVDFQDKERHPAEYDLLQSLMDLRLVHLINARLSDERHAGHRSEVYMLDLSEFTGTRFRRNLSVLDFVKDHLILKNTGGTAQPRPGDTPKRLLGILRRAPLFELSKLSGFIPTLSSNR